MVRKSKEKTVPEYFKWRYGRGNGLITALIMIPPVLGDCVIQFTATGLLLKVLTGWSFTTSLLVSAIVIILYSYLGGLYSITMTDVIQWIIIIIGTLITIPYALNSVGGWDKLVASIPAESFNLTSGIGWPTIISLIIMYIASFLVGQETVQKFYSARDEKTAKQAALICSGMYLLFAFVPAILGLICLGAVKTGVISSAIIEQNGARYVLPTLSFYVLPKIILGFLTAALASATMSSASSDLIGAASIWVNDIHKEFINKNASEQQQLKVVKLAMLALGIIALGISLLNIKNLINVLMFCFTLKAAGTFFPYFFGHFWKGASKVGSYFSIISASTLVILMENFNLKIFGLEPIIPGLIIGFVTFILGSYLFPDKTFPGTKSEEELFD